VRRIVLSLLLAGLMLASAASAASGEGRFRAEGDVVLSGVQSLALPGGFLTTASMDPDHFTFTITAASVELERTWAEQLRVKTVDPIPEVYHTFDVQHETQSFGPLEGGVVTLHPDSLDAALVAWGVGSTVARADHRESAMELVADGTADPFMTVTTGDKAELTTDDFGIDFAHFAAASGPGAMTVTGDFSIFLFNVDYVLSDAEGDHAFSTGFRPGDNGREIVEKNVLRVVGGTLVVETAGAVLRGDRFDATIDGPLALEDADGYFDQERTRYEAHDRAVTLEGALTVEAEAVDSGSDAPTAFLTLSGDLRRANVAPTGRPGPAVDAPTAAKGAAAIGGSVFLVVGSVLLARRGRERWVAGHVHDASQCVEHALEASMRNRHKEALRWYRRARALAPADPILALDEGHAADAVGDVPAARRAYEDALRLDQDLAEAHLRYARTLATQGMQPSALSHLGRALALEPGLVELAKDDQAFSSWRDHPRFAELVAFYDAGILRR